MKKFTLFIVAITFINVLYAQDAMSYNWEEPTYDISEEEASENGIILKDFRSIYFKKANGPYIKINNKSKTIHKRIYVNSDEVIEGYNKVFIPTRDVKDVNRLKVRTINKDGNVTDFNPENLKVLDNIEGYGEFTIFAIEGIQKGAIIEYMYEFEMLPTFYGSELFQFDLPIKHAELYLYGKGLEFDTKGYNGATIKTIKDGRKNNIYGGVMKDIPAFREESYAANHANKLRVDYVVKGFDWNGLSQSLMRYTYTNADLLKQIKKVLDKEVGVGKLKSKSEKIKAIEAYVKDNYLIIKDYSSDLTDIEIILDTKFASETGIIFLFSALFNAAKIDYELVASCDRFNRKFDRDFPTPYNLDYLIFYFADLRQFLSPYPFEYHNGLIPDYLLTQKGFSVASTYNKVKNANHTFRFLDIDNRSDLRTKVIEDITVHLTKDEDPFISVMIELQGYRALEFISVYNQVALDRRKEFATFYVPQSLANQVSPNKITLNGSSDFSENLEENQVTIYAELPAEQFIEKAGNSILFKLGDLIGKQMELYQEEARTQDIELNYPVDYDRTITFNYDEGFTVEGQEEIIIETNKMTQELIDLMGFYSSYEDNGKQLKVNIDEYYNFIHMDKQHYLDFRDVINAAADFNKVSLLITYN